MRVVLLFLSTLFVGSPVLSQNKVVQSNFSSSGGSRSENSTQRLYSVIGQPIAISNTNRSQAQAGFMQVVDYVIADAIAPVITYTGGSQKISKQALPTFATTITDNISVASAKIRYRKISEASWSFSDLTKNGNSYSASIQPTWFDAMGMEYYFEASDATPNTKREPATGSYYAYMTSNEETIPSERIGFVSTGAGKPEDYKIIAMPYVTDNNSVTSLFEEFGPFSNTKWRLARYDNSSDTFQEYPTFTALSRGVGYWVLAKTPIDVKIGPVESPSENRAAINTMTLKPNWNMIGNPYPVSIDWSDVRTLNNNPSIGEIKVYNSGFTNGDLIAPYEGGFVFNNGTSDIIIKIPFVGQTVEGGREQNIFSNDIASNEWLVNLSLEQGNSSYRLGGFGMHPQASIESDQFDDYNPPAFLNSLEINFPHPEHRLGNFCRDVVSLKEEAIWSFKAQGEVGKLMTITWNSDLVTNEKQLFLVDEVNLSITDFSASNNYTFRLENDHSFKIYFGENIRKKIQPNLISILAPYPNPVSITETPIFKIGLPDSHSSFTVHIEIINGTGTPIGSFSGSASSGIHEFNLELKSEQINIGLHYYRISISSKFERKVFTGKLIIR